MDLTDIRLEERYEMMRKRHSFFRKIVKFYSSFDQLIRDRGEWFATLGIKLTHEEKYVSIYMQLDYTDYEIYHIIPDHKGMLTVSNIILWQHPYCYNELLNIFTTLEEVEEEDILTSI